MSLSKDPVDQKVLRRLHVLTWTTLLGISMAQPSIRGLDLLISVLARAPMDIDVDNPFPKTLLLGLDQIAAVN